MNDKEYKERFKLIVSLTGRTDADMAEALGLALSSYKKGLEPSTACPKWVKSAVLLFTSPIKGIEEVEPKTSTATFTVNNEVLTIELPL